MRKCKKENITRLYQLPAYAVNEKGGWARRHRDAVAHARRQGSVLAVVFVDLDDFKAVNDRHGHPVGDAVLKGVVKLKGAVENIGPRTE